MTQAQPRRLQATVHPASAVALALLLFGGQAAAQAGSHPPAGPAASDEAAFVAESEASMHRMMHAMAVAPSGSIDQDFVAMMRPHHQGAIDMAQAYLRVGSNEQLRRIAQEIIVEQGQEIAAMDLALGRAPPPPAPAPTQPAPRIAVERQGNGGSTEAQHHPKAMQEIVR